VTTVRTCLWRRVRCNLVAGLFEHVCMCRPPSTVGMDERAGGQDWTCPTCGRRWYLEHYHAEDGRYLGCSWMGEVAERRRGRP